MPYSYKYGEVMISGRMDSLFSSKIRKILTLISFSLVFICIFLVRYFQDDVLSIAWLYAMYVCIMFLMVLYKNNLNKYEIAIFCFLGIQLVAVVPVPGNMPSLIGTSYLLSYRYGVSSRSFVATIIDFFTRGGFISRYFIWHFIFSSTIFLSFVTAVCLGTTIQKAKDDTKLFLIFLTLLFLSCFTAPVAYFFIGNFGRTEIFAMLILFLVMLVITKPVVRCIIPLLAVIVIAIHLIFAFFFIPFIGVLLLYEICKKTEIKKHVVFLFVATIKTLFIVFICYLLFARETFVFEDARSFYEYLNTRTDIIFSEMCLYMTMFASLEDHLIYWGNTVQLGFHGHWTILINIPIVGLFVVFWIKCFLKETEKAMKLFFLLPILVLPFQAMAFFMFFDFGRWMIMVLNVQFMLFFYLAFVNNSTVLTVAQKSIPFVKRNAFFVILLYLIIAFLGPVGIIGPSERIVNIFYTARQFIGL